MAYGADGAGAAFEVAVEDDGLFGVGVVGDFGVGEEGSTGTAGLCL